MENLKGDMIECVWENKLLGVSQFMFLVIVRPIAHMPVLEIMKRVYLSQCYGPVSTPRGSMLAMR